MNEVKKIQIHLPVKFRMYSTVFYVDTDPPCVPFSFGSRNNRRLGVSTAQGTSNLFLRLISIRIASQALASVSYHVMLRGLQTRPAFTVLCL